MDVGTTLRNARERRGVSLEQLAATTRITLPLLHAIENNAFDTVPSGIFARGFIRSYAREVGLDPEEMVEQFLEETGDTSAVAAHASDAHIDDIRVLQVDPEPSSGRATWGYALIVAALAVAFISSTRTGGSEEDLTPLIAAEELGVREAHAITAANTVSEPDAVATSGNHVFRLDIAATGPCWVEAVVDGKTVIYRLMQPGERESFSAREIALKVGDPAAFTYAINGRPGRSLGPAGIRATVQVTTDSYQQFFAS